MRILIFEPAGVMYDLCYQSLLLSPHPIQNRADQRTHATLLTEMEKLGQKGAFVPSPLNPAVQFQSFTCPTGGELYLEDAEWERLKRDVEATAYAPWFSKTFSRDMERTMTYLETLPAVERKDAVPKEPVPA